MTKYMTNRNFNNKAFAEMLNSKGIEAYETEGGVILNKEAYNAYPKYKMPMLMYQNLEFINNPYCTEEI